MKDNNTVGSTTGLKGKAASFVRANQEFLSIPDSPLLSGGNTDFTLVANVYLNNNTSMFVIMDKSDSASAYDYRLAHNAGTGFRFRVGPDPAYVDSGAVTANAWHLVIAWYDSTADTINIQVDNGTVKSVSFSAGSMDTAYPLAIGAKADGAIGLDGRMDEVAIYRRVLSSAERTWLYNNGQGRAYGGLGMSYLYADTAHAHAVTSLANGNSYQYDANGNQTKRTIGTDTYLLSYDAENRLSQVCKDTSNNAICDAGEEEQAAKFYYDADGKRVKSILGSETTLFIGAHYEIANPGSGQTVTKYYFAGAQRVAMRKYVIPSSMSVEYLLDDHLGSTSLTTDTNGAKVSEIRYRAWGEIRYSWTSGVASTPAYKLSNYTYTGQFSYMDDPTTAPAEGFGLMFYNARWYDPYLNQFSQPDSIIPDPYNPQDWNRYAYARNNPLRYTDPSGHCSIPVGLTFVNGVWVVQYSDALCPNDLDNLLPDNEEDVVTSLIDELEYTGPSVPLSDPPEWGNDVFDLGGNSEFDRVPGDTGPEIIDPVPGNDLDDLIMRSDKKKDDLEFIEDLMRKYGLNPNDRKSGLQRKIHDWITNQDLTEDKIEVEIAEFAREQKEKEARKNRGR